MPIQLVYGNDLASLVPLLAGRVRASQARDPLTPVRIVVPRRGVGTYATLALAEHAGIAANVQTVSLTRVVDDAVAAADVRVLSREALFVHVLSLFDDARALEAPELAAVRRYLAAGPDEDALVRKLSLARAVAGLFDEYARSRPELLDLFRRGPLGEGGEDGVWQRHLHAALFDERGVLRAGEKPRAFPLDALALAGSAARMPAEVLVFGLAPPPPQTSAILARLAQSTDVTLLATNPCREFWEDEDVAESPLLALWGRAGKVGMRALNELCGFAFETRFVEPSGRTLLAGFARATLDRAPPPTAPVPPESGDRSVRVLSCPSRTRELEIVADAIWDAVATTEPPLRFHEIAVVLPDAERASYQALAASTLREAARIPCRLVGRPLSATSRAVEALLLLLSLPLAPMTRDRLLRVLVHPAVLARAPGVSAADLTAIVSDLGIAWGTDRLDLQATYVERDLLHWEQGLRRLVLGAFLEGERDGETRLFEQDGERYVPRAVSGEEVAVAGALVRLARPLLSDTRRMRTARLPVASWARLFVELVTTHLALLPGEEDARMRALDALARLADHDTTGRPVPYAVAEALAREAIERLVDPAAEPLTGGVTVAPLELIRGVPFRVIFVVGMGEGSFPRTAGSGPLDLGRRLRKAGEPTLAEHDRYAFLETLLAARDRLVVSYVARDETTGEPRRPSVVVAELLGLVRAHAGDAAAADAVATHPRARWDDAYFESRPVASRDAAHVGAGSPPSLPSFSAEARGEARMVALRRAIDAAGGPPPEDLQDLLARLPQASRALLAERVRLASPPDDGQATSARRSVTLSALRGFLECPLQGAARFALGMREEDDATDDEDETMVGDVLSRSMLLRGALREGLGDRGAMQAALSRLYERLELTGRMPTGVLAEAERGRLSVILDGWATMLEGEGLAGLPGFRVVRLGRSPDGATSGERLPAVPLPLEPARRDPRRNGLPEVVALSGETPLFSPFFDVSVQTTLSKSTKDVHLLPAWLALNALAAAGIPLPRHHDVVVLRDPGGKGPLRRRLEVPERAAALTYLAALAEELLFEPHAYLMPIEAVATFRDKAPIPFAQALADTVEGDRPFRSLYGPVHHPLRFPAPDETSARERIARRFGPFDVAMGAR